MKYVFRLLFALVWALCILYTAVLYVVFRFIIYPAWYLRWYKAGEDDMWYYIKHDGWVEIWQVITGSYISPEDAYIKKEAERIANLYKDQL